METDDKQPITLESLATDVRGLSGKVTNLDEQMKKMAADIHFMQEFLVKSFNLVVTKDGLALCATKEDLKRFATKEDLKRFATKEDLKLVKHELKVEIRLVRNALQGHVADYKDR